MALFNKGDTLAKLDRVDVLAPGQGSHRAAQTRHRTGKPVAHPNDVYHHQRQEQKRGDRRRTVEEPHVVEVGIEHSGRTGHNPPAQQHQGDRGQADHPVEHDPGDQSPLNLGVDEQLFTWCLFHGHRTRTSSSTTSRPTSTVAAKPNRLAPIKKQLPH